MKKTAWLILLFLASQAAQANSNVIVGRASVIDADTLEIHGQRIRLFGIDAIESRQTCTRDGKPWRCGQAASLALDEWIGDKTVSCNVTGTDRWQRKIARCFVQKQDMQAWLVANGWAMAFRQFSHQYVPFEDQARRDRLGIWSSEFTPPWQWRKETRSQSAA